MQLNKKHDTTLYNSKNIKNIIFALAPIDKHKKYGGIINMKQDLSSHGYEMIRQMERHQQEGEVTYQGLALKQDQEVIIKEFSFADSDANWARFEAYEREVEILKQLQHPRIPSFLDALETPEGFCLITEYQEGKSLAEKRNFTPEQIKQIAISILEILDEKFVKIQKFCTVWLLTTLISQEKLTKIGKI